MFLYVWILIAYVLVCVYGINGAKGFVQGFWQLLVILSVMNLMDRFLIDGYWVGHTNAWTIPGTEDLKPYITAKDKAKKWLFGTGLCKKVEKTADGRIFPITVLSSLPPAPSL